MTRTCKKQINEPSGQPKSPIASLLTSTSNAATGLPPPFHIESMDMKCALAAVFAICLNIQLFAQNGQDGQNCYRVSIVELALPAEAELPISLDDELSPEEILRNEKFTRKQTVQFSVLEGSFDLR